MKKILVILLVSSSLVFGLSNNRIFEIVSEKYQIDKNLLIAFAELESKSNNSTIAYNVDCKNAKRDMEYFNMIGIKAKKLKYKDGYRIILLTSSRNESMVACYHVKNYKNVDYGIMQINSENLKRHRIKPLVMMLYPKKNIEFAAKVIRTCYSKFKGVDKDWIECYNKGTNKKKFTYNYYGKFKKTYMKIKGLL